MGWFSCSSCKCRGGETVWCQMRIARKDSGIAYFEDENGKKRVIAITFQLGLQTLALLTKNGIVDLTMNLRHSRIRC